MNCAKCRKIISDKFSGGISTQDAGELEKHISSCSECRKYHDENLAFAKAIGELDTASVRNASREAFSRLALAVRSYREPKPVLEGMFQFNRLRTATVAAIMLLVLVGLSNLNYSYSYTSGASMEISFNPPLEKSSAINTDEFYNRIHEVVGNALDGSGDKSRISWACTMKENLLEKVSIDVKTGSAKDITGVYDSLIENYPPFSKGRLSVSPLKEPVKAPFYKYLLSRKKDIISKGQIREIVNTDLLNHVEKIKNETRSLEENNGKIQGIIESELPSIRDIIRNAVSMMNEAGGMKILTTIEKGGAQVEKVPGKFDADKYIYKEIKTLLENKGLKLRNSDLEKLLDIEFDGSKTRITVGDTGNGLFSSRSVGGWVVTVIQGSSRGIELGNYGVIIKPEEIDNLLNGFLSSDVLESIVKDRIKDKTASGQQVNDETTVIDVWKGDRQAQIIIKRDDISIETPERSDLDKNSIIDGQIKPKLDSSGGKKAESDLIFRNIGETPNGSQKQCTPPSFSNEASVLPDFITEEDIRKLADKLVTPLELELIINNRIESRNLHPADQNILLVRGGVAITIKAIGGKVVVKVSEVTGSSGNNNSIVIKFSNSQSRDGRQVKD